MGNLKFSEGINIIQGPNESGKSTVAEAIAVTFCGVDASGGKSPDHLITEGQNEFSTVVVTNKTTLRRKKKRGATSVLEIETGAGVIKPTQSEFQKMLKMSAPAWLSLWKTGFFTSLSAKEQMAVISELMPVDGFQILEQKGIMDQINTYTPYIKNTIKLLNCKREAELIATERRNQQNLVSRKQGEVDGLMAQVNAIQGATNKESIDIESYEGMLNDLRAQLSEIDGYESAVNLYNTNNARFAEKEKTLFAKQKELADVKALVTTQDVSDEDIAKMEQELNEARALAQGFVNSKKPLPAPPHRGKMPDTPECPTCLRSIDNADRTIFIKHQEEAFNAYNKEAREIADYNKDLDDKIKNINDLGLKLKKKYDDAILSKKIAAENKKTQDARMKVIETDISVLENYLKENKPAAPKQPEIMQKKTKASLSKEIEETFAQITTMRQGETGAAEFKKKIQILEQDIQKLNTEIEVLAVVEKAVAHMPLLKTAIILENLHIEGIQLSIEDDALTIKDGMNVPYSSLSAGRKIKTSIKLCLKLRELAGKNAPPWLFVDDADLMDEWKDLMPEGLQIFVAKVDANISEVMVVSL